MKIINLEIHNFSSYFGTHKIDFQTDTNIEGFAIFGHEGRGKTSAGVSELDFFPEPGFFLVKPDNSIFYIATQSMPFARPQFKDLLVSLRFILDKSYPARGNIE